MSINGEKCLFVFLKAQVDDLKGLILSLPSDTHGREKKLENIIF